MRKPRAERSAALGTVAYGFTRREVPPFQGLALKPWGLSPSFVGPRIANGGSFRVGWQTPSLNRSCPEVTLRLPPANGLNPFGIPGW